MALGSTQPLTEMGSRSLPGGKGGRQEFKVDNLVAICETIVYEFWDPRRTATLLTFTAL
jgi:hypothetical protein